MNWFVFKQLICYLFLKAKAKGGAKGGGRRVALLEVVGVEVGLVAEPVHESIDEPDFFDHVLGRFSVRGVQKHDKKSRNFF
jgi:hypothetical protein